MLKVRSAAIYSLVFLIATFVSQILITRSITNNLGLEVYGVWAIIMSIQAYLFVADSGFSSSVTTYANIFETRGHSHKVRALLATNIYLLTVIFSIILIVGIFIGGQLDYLEFDWGFLIAVATINVYILSISGVFSNLLIAYFQVDVSKLLQIVNVVIMTFLVLFFSERGSGIEGIVLALIGSSAIYLLILAVYVAKKHAKTIYGGVFFFDVKIFKEVYEFSVNTFIIALASRIQFYTDVLIVGLFLGLTQTSTYEINNKLPFYATYLASSFVILYYPLMTRMYTKENIKKLRDMYFSVQFISVFLGVTISLILYLYIDDILNYWIESDVRVDNEVFLLMLVSLVLHSILGPVATLLQSIGRNTTLMYAEVFTALVNILLSVYLINLYGLLGVISGTVIAQFGFLLFIYPYMLKTVLQVKFDYFIREVALPLILSFFGVAILLYFYADLAREFDGVLMILASSVVIGILTAIVFLMSDFACYKLHLKKCLSFDVVSRPSKYS